MSEVIKTPHDVFFKASFSDVNIATDFLKSYLPEDVLKHVDLSTLEPQKDSYVDGNLKEQFSDMLYRVIINNREGYFYMLAEHKSYNDKMSVLQLLRYMVSIWESKVGKEKHKELPMILPMLVYHNKGEWKAHMKLSDWIEGYDELPEEMKRYVPDYEYLLHDLGKYVKDEISKDIRTELAIKILDRGRYASTEEIKQLISEAIEVMVKLRLKGESTEIIEACIKYILSIRDDLTTKEVARVAGSVSEDGGEFVMTVAEQLRQEGEQRGELKRARETAIELIKMGLTVEQIMTATKLPKEEIETLRKEISS